MMKLLNAHLLNTSLLLFCLLLSSNSFSADTAAPTLKEIADKKQAEEKVIQELTDAPKKGPYDEYSRSTPRSSLLALSAAIKDKDYDRAVNYLDLRNLPFAGEKDKQKNKDTELVKQLAVVARRAMTINLEGLSDDPHGLKEDGLPSYRDRVTTLKTRDGPVDILMQRVPRGDGVFIWKISNATVALIPKLNSEFGYGFIGEKMSQILPSYVIGAFELWQIVLLTGLLLVGLIISYLITFILGKLIQRTNSFNKQRVQKFVFGPLRLLIVVLFIRSTFELTAPSLVGRAIFEAKTFFIIAILWVLMGVIDLVIFRLAERMKRNGQDDAVVLLKPISTTIKIVIVILAVITWMNNLGYEVTALLAGLGVGGIAVALAAQKSLENLIGSIIIYTSQPVKVGDFCQFGTIVGTVEEIGLRATQLRTLSRTVVHVPNALFAAGTIENLTQRDKILYRTRLRLSYKDTPDQVEQVLAKIRKLIDEHEFLDEENSRVRFLEFGEYAQELELFAYIKTRDFAEYLEHREDVNLKINKIIESVGVELVVPTRSIDLYTSTEGLPVSK